MKSHVLAQFPNILALFLCCACPFCPLNISGKFIKAICREGNLFISALLQDNKNPCIHINIATFSPAKTFFKKGTSSCRTSGTVPVKNTLLLLELPNTPQKGKATPPGHLALRPHIIQNNACQCLHKRINNTHKSSFLSFLERLEWFLSTSSSLGCTHWNIISFQNKNLKHMFRKGQFLSLLSPSGGGGGGIVVKYFFRTRL